MYNSAQPRAPEGRSNGGQWISFTHASASELKARGATPADAELNDLHYDKATKQWLTKDGKPVSPHIAARLKAVGAKVGWQRVSLNPDEDAPAMARGIDAKGRTQTLYSAAHSEAASAEKFARLRDFNTALPELRANIAKDLAAGNDAAAVLSVIDRTGIRLGSNRETFAAQKAYGASTLLGQHIKLDGDKVSLSFIGKSGKLNERTFSDSALAGYIRARGAGPNDRVFSSRDTAVRAYMDNVAGTKDFSPKDFRTWHGTAQAIRAVEAEPKPSNAKEWTRLHASVSKKVAAFLGNTPAVAAKYYIDPSVWPDKKGW